MHNNIIVVALHGDFSFPDDAVAQSVVNIVQYERDFWSDDAYPYFFTSLIGEEGQGSSGGTAHHNSFGMFQSESMPFSQSLSWLISHEYFHTWLGQHLKMPQPEETSKWFSEGFTDYYAYKILRLAGITTEKDFIAKINEIIKSYYLSPRFNTPNDYIVGRYWSDGNLKQLSYQRGLVIAFLLDNSIAGSTGLDGLLKTLYRQSAPGYVFSKQLFNRLVNQYANAGMVALIDSINNGNNSGMQQAFGKLTTYHTHVVTIDKLFDIGFNLNASMQAHAITRLIKGSNAEKAGLYEGEECTGGVSIWNNNTEKPAKIQVVKDGQKLWVEYMPVRETDIKVPQVLID